MARRASAGVLELIPQTKERLEAAWEVWTLDQRQAVLRMILDAVLVNKAQHVGRRFDASRVKLVWRV